jgi:hypothetical protein
VAISIHNLRTRHAVVTRDPPNMDLPDITSKFCNVAVFVTVKQMCHTQFVYIFKIYLHTKYTFLTPMIYFLLS